MTNINRSVNNVYPPFVKPTSNSVNADKPRDTFSITFLGAAYSVPRRTALYTLEPKEPDYSILPRRMHVKDRRTD